MGKAMCTLYNHLAKMFVSNKHEVVFERPQKYSRIYYQNTNFSEKARAATI